jgi:hypothetical protein
MAIIAMRLEPENVSAVSVSSALKAPIKAVEGIPPSALITAAF